MIPKIVRDIYYLTLSPLMRLNSWRHRQWSSVTKSSRRAHLGPGQKRYLPGWVNVDANLISSHPDVWADLRYKLPFSDESLDAIYSHHMIEHLPDLDFHFAEMYRCLKPGGVLRVGGPHGDNAMLALQRGDIDWFGTWPKNRNSIGGRFENFIFCSGEHLTILTQSFLEELCNQSGFVDFSVVMPKDTAYPHVIDTSVLESERWGDHELPTTLLIEARKP